MSGTVARLKTKYIGHLEAAYEQQESDTSTPMKTVNIKVGDVENTGTLFFVLEQTDSTFSLKEGHFSSPHYQVSWEPVMMDIKEGNLYFNNEKVGVITEELLDVNRYDKNSRQYFQYHAERLDERTIRYQEIWMDEDHKIIYSLQSDLSLK